MSLENQKLYIGFCEYDENLYDENLDFKSFFFIVPYQVLVREQTAKNSSKVTKGMLNNKCVQDAIKVLENANILLSPDDKNDIARVCKEKGGKLAKEEIKLLRDEYMKKGRVRSPDVEVSIKIEDRLKIARHVIYKDKLQKETFEFPVGRSLNILKMPCGFLIDSKGDENDPNNVVNPCDEFYFDGSKIAFNQSNIPYLTGSGSSRTLHEIKKSYLDLIKEVVFIENDATYTLLFYWVLHSFMCKIWSHTPYLNIVGSTASGKSTLLKSIAYLNQNSMIATVPSTATLYRLANSGISLLWDESDSLKNLESDDTKAQLSILRAGFDVDTSWIPRCNQDNEVEKYCSFCPKVICSEWDLPDSLESLKNRCFNIRMVTSMKSLRDIRLMKQKFDKLSQEMVDWCFENFSIYKLITLKFQDIVEKSKNVQIPPFIKDSYENLTKYAERFFQLKHRMQDISKPILVLASDCMDDLNVIHDFLRSQQEFLLNEIKQTSPEYNLLKCLNDICTGYCSTFDYYMKDELKIAKTEDFFKIVEGDTVQVSHYHLKSLLKTKYNIYKIQVEQIVETFKVFNIKMEIVKPQNRVWYQFNRDTLAKAFKRKEISLGMESQKKEPKNAKLFDVSEILMDKKESPKDINEQQINDFIEKVAQLLGNVKNTTFPELQNYLQVFNLEEVEVLKQALEIMETQKFIKMSGANDITLL